MSIELYPTRLFFRDGHGGCAKHDGVRVDLHAPPPVPVAHLREIDWWPHRGELRVSAEGWREMTKDEGDACMAYLERIARAALAAREGGTHGT